MHNIYWNTTNPMFRIDNTDNIIDINVDNLAWEYDQANIICPRYRKGTREADVEQYVIYNVSKEEYEDCRIIQPHPRVIAICDQPLDLKYVTITFRSFTPTPGGMEFKPGQDYYFISTSSRNDLYRRLGGRCSTHNMRLTFKVAESNSKSSDNSNIVESEDRSVNVPRFEYPSTDEGSIEVLEEGADQVLQKSTKLSDFHSYLYPTREIVEVDSNSVEHEKRRSDNYANEVIKQASVMHSDATKTSFNYHQCFMMLLLSTLLAVILR